jgi:hypothetical protein
MDLQREKSSLFRAAFNLSCFLPFGKAEVEDPPQEGYRISCVVKGSRSASGGLQPHPRRLGSAASSTFATLGFISVGNDVPVDE